MHFLVTIISVECCRVDRQESTKTTYIVKHENHNVDTALVLTAMKAVTQKKIVKSYVALHMRWKVLEMQYICLLLHCHHVLLCMLKMKADGN